MSKNAKRLIAVLVIMLVQLMLVAPVLAGDNPSVNPQTDPVAQPLQLASNGHILGFLPDRVYLAGLDHALTVRFLGGNQVVPGSVPGSGGKPGAPSSLGKVTYHNIWQGVDATFSATKTGIVESSYQLAPNGSVDAIHLAYNVPIQLMKDGSLQLAFESGLFSESAPVAWQEINGRHIEVAVRFIKLGTQEVGFELGPYDIGYAVTIDPVYTWHTFYGGSGTDGSNGIALDKDGNVYVAGYSYSSWKGPGSIAPLHSYAGNYDMVVVKLDGNGIYQWHTFYGGSNMDSASAIAVDGNGNVYVAGISGSAWNGPGSTPPLNAYKNSYDIVVIKLNTNGAYQWHTFYGGSSTDSGNSIAVDGSGNVYVSAESPASWDGPGNTPPLNTFTGNYDIAVLQLDTTGTYQWHTFYGGTGTDNGTAIAVDGNGNAYVTGYSTAGWNGPGSTLPLNAFAGSYDIVALKLDKDGNYQWHTFYGSNFGSDQGNGIAADKDGNVYIVGKSDFTWNGPGSTLPLNAQAGGDDIVVIKLTANGNYQWHSFLGSPSTDIGNSGYVDANGNVYITGESSATWNGPGSIEPLNAYAGAADIMIAKLDTNGIYQWHTFYGSTDTDSGNAIAVDANGNVFAAGESSLTWDGPGSTVPLNSYAGGNDIVVTKTNDDTTPPVVLSIALADPNPTSAASVDFTVTFSEAVTGVDTAAPFNDFALTTSGVSGAAVSGVSGTGNVYTVTVSTGAGSGAIRLDVIDNDTILDLLSNPLGGPGAGNGNFTSGETYTVVENQPPTDISLSSVSVPENQPIGTTVGTFTTTDPDAGNTFTYSLVSGAGSTDNASFSISGSALKTAVVFNYLAKNSYSIRVRTTDQGSLYYEKALTINITDQPNIFGDVPDSYWAVSWIERLYNAGITGGCSTSPLLYCPDDTVTRAEMAVFLLKGIHGNSYSPPAATGTIFTDVPIDYWAAKWIEELSKEGITGGCAAGLYCPDAVITRAQMAVFLLKSEHGSSYSPPAATGTVFTDVPADYWAAKWIEQLATEGITGGCGGTNYCPGDSVTRAQMAVFLVKTFNLP